MSSHREAPGISKDPVADSTDLYAFTSPDAPDTVTLIANYIPLEAPAGGPNFYEFGDDVLYEIAIDNDGDAQPEIIYQFRFVTQLHNNDTFLYNTGPIDSLVSANWNRRQVYEVYRWTGGPWVPLAKGLKCPPVNIGPRSTPDYESLAQAAVHSIGNGIKVFAGQRREGFFVDLGSIFDLGTLRPFEMAHLISTPNANGVDTLKSSNVHTIAIQVPKSQLTADGSTPADVASATSVIGVHTRASRRKAHIRNTNGTITESGPWTQVSRLGNPLINEVVVPMALKDFWNSQVPWQDSQFAAAGLHPELAKLLPVLYPGVFPNLAAYTKPRADLAAILLTGIPSGVVPGFQNYTGKTIADQLRLNMAIPPTTSNPNPAGLVAGDAAGYPNGRRVFDDVVTIEIRAIAGLTIPLVDKSFTPDAATSAVTDGVAPDASRYQSTFPYLGVPLDGYDTPSS
ncbi:MAG TPA: DUF4331 domain-containing protein [Candidatus Saccharimonadales bacterium]|nr:DUF4331 domain-containing protein [Candidatus Saccharimonadales bacterium]